MKVNVKALLSFTLLIGILLTSFAFYMSWTYGQLWLVEKGDTVWRLNNYTIVPCWLAYSVFGVLFLWLGCFLLGITIPAGRLYGLFTKYHWKKAGALLISAVVMVALGFNTLDWMCGWLYWNEGNPQPVPMSIFDFSFTLDPWNFYFGGIILPLTVSGFLLGFSIVWLTKLKR